MLAFAQWDKDDLLSRPCRPHRWQRRDHSDMRVDATHGIGVAPLRAARVEQQIVELPNGEVVIVLAHAAFVSCIRIDNHLASHQQCQECDPRRAVPQSQLFDLLRRGERREKRRELRIADPEQGACAR